MEILKNVFVQKGNNWNSKGNAVVTYTNTIFTIFFLLSNTTVLHKINTVILI